MNKQQASGIVRSTFSSAFDKSQFGQFALNILNRMDESKAQQWSTQYIKDAFKPHVHRYERLGTYTAPDERKLDVLIVHLAADSKLERARTAARNFVADHLKKRDEKDAALVAFVSPSEQQWRFSYVKMEYATVEKDSGKIGVEERLTPARRFSYLVGEGESCHTAQTRFLGLLQETDKDPGLEDIEEAFSVEAVTDEFFERYVALFEDIHAALDKLAAKDKVIRDEFKSMGVSTVDFAKKLLGQIVFLYFLQKKGWLGVEKGREWGTGPRGFMRRLAKGEYGKYNNFFNDILEPLFYDTLATDRGHEAWCNRFKCRIPFLNGGLFEPIAGYDWQKTDIVLPNDLFTNDEEVEEGIVGTGVLDVFDRYNFTVNESEPLEKEVAIDPEMLGKVFENLIEDNRRKGLGAFYTPREIVHYMCQESLINYLDTALNGAPASAPAKMEIQGGLFGAEPTQLSLPPGGKKGAVPREDIETFVRLGEQISHYESVKAAYDFKMPKSIEKNAKTLDDALKSIAVCDPAVGSGAFPVGMLTEIVRARSSLTPYFNEAGERTPYYFKRHAIQNCLYGADIDPGAVEIAKLRLWLSLVVDEEDVKQIKPLPNLDYKIVWGDSLLGFPFKSNRITKIEALKLKFFDETNAGKKKALKQEIDAEIEAAFASSKKSLGVGVSFDFEIFFSEVFHAKQGFDVVIANPPYVSVEKFARTALQTEWKRRYKTFASRGDIYCFFYERGLGLLREGGVLSFISSNKFQRAGYGKELRELLASQRIRALVDFCELPVFAAATDPMIVIVNKGLPPANHEIPVVVIKDESEFESLHHSLASRGSLYKPNQLKSEGWSLQGGIGLAIIQKMSSAGTPLGNIKSYSIMAGIKTGFNKAFWLDSETAQRLKREDPCSYKKFIKPVLVGDDARRWSAKPVTAYMIYTPRGTLEKELGALKQHLLKWKTRLEGRALDQKWYELQQAQYRYSSTYESPKIVYPDIALESRFSIDSQGRYPDMTAFSIPCADLWLLALLNSKAEWFFLSRTAAVLGDADNRGRVRCKTQYISKIPVPEIGASDKTRLAKLAEKAARQAESEDTVDLRTTEREIDEIVYRLFDLTADEIAYIEKSLAGVDRYAANGDEEEEEA